MKYDEYDEEMLDSYGVEKTSIKDDCFVCKDKTEFLDTYFKVHSCSQKCSRLLVKHVLNEVRDLHAKLDRMEERLSKYLR